MYKMKSVRYSLRWIMVLLLLVAFKAQSQSTETYKYTPSEVVTYGCLFRCPAIYF